MARATIDLDLDNKGEFQNVTYLLFMRRQHHGQ